MRALFVYRRHAIWLLSCFFVLMASVGRSEVISIEEFLRTVMASKTATQIYSHNFEEVIKGYKRGNDFFAVQTSSRIHIFNSEGELQNTITPKSRMVVREILENKSMLFASTQNESGEHVRGLFKLDGTPVRMYSNRNIFPSPGGEYSYTRCSMESSGPIYVYDKEENLNFKIPLRFECQVSAPSDSQLIVLHDKSLSLWDVNTRQEIWHSNIPNEDYYTDSAFDMAFSVKNDIIVLRNMHNCYCYDFQGNYLWGQDGPGDNNRINMIGVSKDDGKVLITTNAPGVINVDLFNRDGSLFLETEINLGPDCIFAANVTWVADVFDNFVLIGFKAKVGHERKRVTGILYYNGSNWISAIIDGRWDLHKSAQGKYTLVGLMRETNELMAYSIK